MKAFLIVGLWSIAAGASARTDRDTNCFLVWGDLRCEVRLEPKPPVGGPAPDGAGVQCRDASGKMTACPASIPKSCKDASGRPADCGAPGAKPA